MNIKKQVLLPGLKDQWAFLRKNVSVPTKNVLVIGSSSEWVAGEFAKSGCENIDLIVEDYESLMNSNLLLGDELNIKVSLMNFEITDFDSDYFELVYAQASVSLINRNKIVKEIKRILKPGGFFCVGEIVALKKDVPPFIADIFDSSNMLPLFVDDLNKYYEERKFQILDSVSLSSTLKDYYAQTVAQLKDTKESLSDREKSYYKKLLNKVNHESNVYLKLGGDKFIGFVSMLMRKGEA